MMQFLLIIFLFVFSNVYPKSVCLNMIVKDERDVIADCVKSVKPLIDYWVIVDTGSHDGTQQIIREVLADVPGELHEKPWVNFAHNRNEALDLAKNHADYILFIDADERLVGTQPFHLPTLDKDFYRIVIHEPGGVDGVRKFLIDSHLDWKWEGVLHEVVICPQAKTYDCIKDFQIVTNLVVGNRSKDSQKFIKDAHMLEEALTKDPNNSRTIFYLAESYGNAREYAKAISFFRKRAEMGGKDPEVFWSLYCIGRMQEMMNADADTIMESYSKAFVSFPMRVEPLYRMAQYYLNHKNFLLVYLISQSARSIPQTSEQSFVERWVYDWGILLQLAESSFYLGKYQESLEAINQLLTIPTLPQDHQKAMKQNWITIHSLMSSQSD